MPTRIFAAALALALAACGGSGTAPSQGTLSQGTPSQGAMPHNVGGVRAVRDLEHASFGLWTTPTAGNGNPFADYYYDADALARPSVNGTWSGTAIAHSCGSGNWHSSNCGRERPLIFGTASITYSAAANEVSVSLTDWRDIAGTRVWEHAQRNPFNMGNPFTVGNYVAGTMDFRGRDGTIRVRFLGGSGGQPSEAFGYWRKSYWEAAFGATRQ